MHRATSVVTLALSTFLVSATALADKRTYKIENNRLVVPTPITFATGKDTVTKESSEAIAYIADYLAEKSYISTLRIEVHSDSMGNEKFNQTLSEKRALSVGKALVAKGVDCKRLIAVGFGSSKPVADNKTAEGRAQNRRTELVNAALRGKAIGGMPVDGGGVVAGDLCAK